MSADLLDHLDAHARQVVPVARGEVIQHAYLEPLRNQCMYEVRADEARAPGD